MKIILIKNNLRLGNMVKKPLKNRIMVNLCNDHISGFLGEALYLFFLKEGLISKKDDKYIITKKGLEELEIVGIDISSFNNNLKKKVTICAENDNGIFYEHIGSHLGSLIARKMIELKWIINFDKNTFELTKKGMDGLGSMGVKMKTYDIPNVVS